MIGRGGKRQAGFLRGKTRMRKGQRKRLFARASALVAPLFRLLCVLAAIAASSGAHAAAPPAAASSGPKAGSFTLSTARSFAPGEKPKIHLYARNVDQLEFRVYHVADPEKFVSNLPELHTFGIDRQGNSEVEQIDEETWLERFHDWKHSLWNDVRDVIRGQLSRETRTALDGKQSGMVKRSRIVGVAEFAQIPLLNDKQLVARWHQQMPPTFVSDGQSLPIDPLPAGMYLIEATDAHLKAYTILMVSETALLTRKGDDGEILAFTVDRKTGVPVAGAKLALSTSAFPIMHATSGADGLAGFRAPKVGKDDDDAQASSASDKLWMMARSGNDVALVAPWYSFTNGAQPNPYEYYTYTDRPVYRPGHTVYFKSVMRQYQGNTLKLPAGKQAHVTVTDALDKTVFEKDLPVSTFGTVAGSLVLPADAAFGSYGIKVLADDDHVEESEATSGNFQVEDYRKPEYQVRVSVAKPRVLQGQPNQATVDARYFFGEPVAGGKVKYTVHQSPHYWWDVDDDDPSAAPEVDASTQGDEEAPDANADADDGGDQEDEQTAKLDADGKLTVNIPTRFLEKGHTDKDYVVEAGVTDEAGREITAKYRFLATYGSFRIHVEPLSYIAHKGDTATFTVTAVDYDDKPVSTPVHLHLSETHTLFGQTTTTNAGDADTTTNADGKGTVALPVTTNGSLNILATAQTPEHRTVQDSTYIYVSGDVAYDNGTDGGSNMRLLADKKSYQPGDIAHLTVAGAVDGFHALVTATGYTIEFKKVLTSAGTRLSFDLPITSDSQPNLTVEAVFMKDEKLYQARKVLKVPPTQQHLQVEITPVAGVFKPQQAAVYDVLARNAKGEPVAAELSFGVVDEAIYSLYPDSSGDMLKTLYPDRYSYATVDTSIEYYFSGSAGDKSPLLAERRTRFGPQLAQVKPSSSVVQPHIRKDFPDTTFWQPAVHTDASGHVRVTLTFPDSLTTWRATARVVTADSKAGAAVNRVIVRKDLIVRLGQPRFLRKGDTITVPVIVHNYLPDTKSINLTLGATGVDIVGGAAQQVDVASKAEAVNLYHLHAANAGTATFTAKALSTGESDGLQLSLPVLPAGVRRSLNAAGVLGDATVASADRSVPINFPSGTDPTVHKLTVEVSPSIAGTMFSALDYLTAYPYGCTEQTMSSFLPNIIVSQAAAKLHLESRVNANSLRSKVQAGFDRLTDYQHEDGGWGWWKEDASQVFMTSYVVSGLGQAQQAGFSAGGAAIGRGVGYLQGVLKAHPKMLPELRAYVLYALAEADAGHADVDMTTLRDQLRTSYDRRNDLSPQALAFTGLALLHVDPKDARVAEIARLLEAKAQTAGELTSWSASRNNLLDIDYDADAESTAYALKFLVATDPTSPLLPRAAQWLVANRNEGYWWSSTQQTAFVLLGLTDYVVASHELAGDSDAEIFVNGASVARRHFTQAEALSGATLQASVDAAHLQPGNSIRVVTHGAGRKYFSAAGTYFSTDKHSYQQGSLSLNITRDYFVLVPDRDAKNNIVYKLQPLNGPVQQGDVLAVHIGVSGSPSKYLVIEDPIPAGAEFISNDSAYSIPDRPGAWETWYTRREFHDDHAAIFADVFSGRKESFYLLKVVNPGSFTISPASVQPNYQPGVQATTDELHLDVKEVQTQ